MRKRPTLLFAISWICVLCEVVPTLACASSPNYHLVGWTNLFVPGAGQAFLGNGWRAGAEASLEVGAFAWGYSMSKLSPLTIDGVPEELPKFSRGARFEKAGIQEALYADILQEVGIKAHMFDTFNSYRLAAKDDPEASKWIDQRPAIEMFKDPYRFSNFSDPWVYVPIIGFGVYTIADYYLSRSSVVRGQRLTPYSNYLYSMNYGIVQPIGSGVPEEAFYRGFLQNEARQVVDSPFFAIPLSTAAFAFSHAPGNGRISAAVAGAYFGTLAYRNHGNLAQGITVHYWGDVFDGIETILLCHEAQRTTPPTSFFVQVNF